MEVINYACLCTLYSNLTLHLPEMSRMFTHRTVTRIVDKKFRNIEPALASALSPAQELIGSLVIFVSVGKELEIEIPTKVTFAVALIGYHQ